jgi:hypothetical protein
MNDLSIGWVVFLVSMALVALAALLWWRYPQLRKNSFQLDPPIVKKAVMSIEQQYAEDIAAGRAVLVVPITGRNDWSSYLRWLRLTGLLLCLYIIIFLPRCQLYFGMSGELLGIVGGLLFFSVNPTFDWIESQWRWSNAKADGYFPSRKTIQKKIFIAYKINDAIQLRRKKSVFFNGATTFFLITVFIIILMMKYSAYPHDWHAMNAQLQQECLSKKVHKSH